jgi:hypothetical protein
MLEFLVYYSQPIKYILLFTFVVFVILIMLMKRHIYAYIDENRIEMQRDPVQLAIVVFYDNLTKTPEEGGGKSFLKAFSELIFSILKEVFKTLMKPVYEVANMFIDLFKSFQQVLDKIRQQIAVMRQMLTNIFRDVYNRIEVSMSTIYFLFFKLRDTLRRMLASVFIMAYMVQHTVNFTDNMMSFFRSLMGFLGSDFGAITVVNFTTLPGLGGLTWLGANPPFCFDPRTTVHALRPGSDTIYSIRFMHDLSIGDRIYNPEDHSVHTIRTIMRFVPNIISYRRLTALHDPRPEYMYNVAGVIVSGTHAMHLSNERMCRVYEDERAHGLEEYHSPYGIISFITDTGIIPCSNGVQFRDYLDTHSAEFHSIIRRSTDKFLNGKTNDFDIRVDVVEEGEAECDDLYTGLISMNGDWESTNNTSEVQGHVDIGCGELSMYEISEYPGLYLSGNTWILDGDNWVLVYRHRNAVYRGKNNKIACHFFTKSNTMTIRSKSNPEIGLIVRDFMEVGDKEYIDKQLQQLEDFGYIE